MVLQELNLELTIFYSDAYMGYICMKFKLRSAIMSLMQLITKENQETFLTTFIAATFVGAVFDREVGILILGMAIVSIPACMLFNYCRGNRREADAGIMPEIVQQVSQAIEGQAMYTAGSHFGALLRHRSVRSSYVDSSNPVGDEAPIFQP